MHYFEFNIKSYQAATSHLTNEEDLAYRRLIEFYYDTEKPIPNALPDKPTALQWLSRRLRVAIPALEIVLGEFFDDTESGWVHEYCESVIAQYHAYIERQKSNGSKGGRGKKADAKPDKPTALPDKPTAKPTNNQQPETNNNIDARKGARFSADAVLNSEWGNAALDLREDWSREDVIEEFDAFKDYWIAQAGAKGVKTDWLATWRNWCRRSNRKGRAAA